jgi:TATA-binding protein-associated factor Taf7
MESQCILRVPRHVAAQLREMMAAGHIEDVEVSLTDDKRKGSFSIGGQQLPVSVVDLPTVVETHRTWDQSHYYKTGHIGQVMIVDPKEDYSEREHCFPDGLTPPAQNIRERLFRNGPEMALREETAYILSKVDKTILKESSEELKKSENEANIARKKEEQLRREEKKLRTSEKVRSVSSVSFKVSGSKYGMADRNDSAVSLSQTGDTPGPTSHPRTQVDPGASPIRMELDDQDDDEGGSANEVDVPLPVLEGAHSVVTSSSDEEGATAPKTRGLAAPPALRPHTLSSHLHPSSQLAEEERIEESGNVFETAASRGAATSTSIAILSDKVDVPSTLTASAPVDHTAPEGQAAPNADTDADTDTTEAENDSRIAALTTDIDSLQQGLAALIKKRDAIANATVKRTMGAAIQQKETQIAEKEAELAALRGGAGGGGGP